MKKIFVFGLVVLSMVGLSGCTPGQTVNEKIGEEMAERAIEQQTGAKVDIDSQGEKVTINSEEGQVQYSAGGEVDLPDGFPKELIMAGDAKVIMASSSDQTSTVSFVTNVEKTAIKQEYLDGLTGQGWKKEMEVDAGTGVMMSFNKERTNVVINIGENNADDHPEKTLVNVMYAIEQN